MFRTLFAGYLGQGVADCGRGRLDAGETGESLVSRLQRSFSVGLQAQKSSETQAEGRIEIRYLRPDGPLLRSEGSDVEGMLLSAHPVISFPAQPPRPGNQLDQ